MNIGWSIIQTLTVEVNVSLNYLSKTLENNFKLF